MDVAALEQRVERMRAFSLLRRRLRELEEPAQIVAAAVSFAHEVLGCASFVIYYGEKDALVLERISDEPAMLVVEPVLPREDEVVVQLARGAPSIPLARVAGRELPAGTHAVAVPLRAAPTELVGVVLAVGSMLDPELVAELAFDLESVLTARMVARLRAEELAVLEIQERELVGLLRDVEARDAIIQRDLEDARAFQHQMLGAPARIADVTIEIVYRPLGLIGGDVYATSVEDGRLRVFVADATGHGIRASLTTMFIKSGYEALRAGAADPAALLARLNDTIAGSYRTSAMLFTAACVDLDLVTGRCICSVGGHPEICVVTSGQATFVEAFGPLLGVRQGLAFTNHESVLGPGDGVYVYTDGLVEARHPTGLFGSERFRQVIAAAHAAGHPAGEAVVTAVGAFLEGAPIGDDATFVGVRRAA